MADEIARPDEASETVELLGTIADNVRTIRNIVVTWALLTLAAALYLLWEISQVQQGSGQADSIADCILAGGTLEVCERVLR